MKPGQQLRERSDSGRERAPRNRGSRRATGRGSSRETRPEVRDDYVLPRAKKKLLTPKRGVILGTTVVVLAAATAYVVRTAVDNANSTETPLTLDEIAGMLNDPFAPDPKTDALKAQAVQAARAAKLKAQRVGDTKDALDPVVIVKKPPAANGATSRSFPPGSTPDPGSNKAIGRQMAAARGWGDDQWGCLERLWDKESHWNEHAMNRYSGAYGIPQALPGSKMASAGGDWQTNPSTQIKWGLGYIAGRYKTPCGAWGHSQATGWY